jgi:tRNA(fMet)-specific endonuclease VapC
MRYLLDANAVVGLLNDRPRNLVQRARREPTRDIAIPAIVAHELFYGAFRSRRTAQNLTRIDALRFEVIEFDKEDARQAGEVRAWLAAQGQPIAPYDVLIAGQAVARNVILVTRNTREFGRVPRFAARELGNLIPGLARLG